MKQFEAVINIMERQGGFSTLKHLNENVLKVPDVEWKTKTPFASIRRIVQDQRYFFKIRPGLWALNSYKNKLPENILEMIEESKMPLLKEHKYTHYYYQGILAEIGALHNYKVYIPAQDKNRPYLNKKLKDVITIDTLPEFTYDYIIKTIKSIDVIWVNEDKYPSAVFEVEHSTDFKNSFNKFHELIYFYTQMIIVSDKERMRQYEAVLNLSVYNKIKNRVKFYDYDKLEDYYVDPIHAQQFIK